MASLLLESELLTLLGGDDKARAMARYCGFDGLGGATLQVVGSEFAITGERVRQILGEVVKRGASVCPQAPVLGRTLDFIAQCIPGFAHEIESKLQAAGLSATPFRIEGIIRAAELFDREPPFSVTEASKGRLVHGLSMQSLDAVVRAARRTVVRRGVTTIQAVAADLRDAVPESIDGRLIASVLAAGTDIRWLDRASEWFWLPDVPRNPLVRRIRKILSVANPVRFSELYAGIAREYRLQSLSPPAEVLVELCRQAPGVQVESDWIKAEPAIDPQEVLSELEQAIVDVLIANGRVMRRAELASVCIQRGLNRASFYSSLSQSPVIASYASELVGVIGTEMTTGPAQNICTRRRSKYLHTHARAHALTLHHLMN
jgi:hypothetical protein